MFNPKKLPTVYYYGYCFNFNLHCLFSLQENQKEEEDQRGEIEGRCDDDSESYLPLAQFRFFSPPYSIINHTSTFDADSDDHPLTGHISDL